MAARRLAIFGEDTPPTGSGAIPGRTGRTASAGTTAAMSSPPRWRDHNCAGSTRYNAPAQRNARLLTAGLDGLPGVQPPQVPDDRSCVFYRYRVTIDADELEFAGPPLELRDRLLWALQAEGVAASLWQLRPLPAQPLFRRGGRFRSWQPGDPDALDPWDPQEFPVAARLLESSIVLGTARAAAVQPAARADGALRRRLPQGPRRPRDAVQRCLPPGGARLGRQAEPLGALHRLGAVAHAELAVERARVLLHGVRREEEALGDLLVGRAGRPCG